MKKYIFITPDGLTCKPNNDSPEPDFLDMQLIGCGQVPTVQDALKDLMELNGNAMADKFERPFSFRIENNNRGNFWFRDYKNKTRLAS